MLGCVDKPRLLLEYPMPISACKDRGLAYGDGVFETVAVTNGCLEHWDAHIERLQSGLCTLSIDAPKAGFWEECKQQAGQYKKAVFKIIATRLSGGRGYSPGEEVLSSCHMRVFVYPYPSRWDDGQQSISLALCKTIIHEHPSLIGLKHLNRLANVLASKELIDLPQQEGVMLNMNGDILEGISSNIFWVAEGVLYTPDLSSGGVCGVAREWIMQNFEVKTGVFKLMSLIRADEVFVCNSIQGVVAVRSLDNTHWKIPGLLTQKISQAWSAGKIL